MRYKAQNPMEYDEAQAGIEELKERIESVLKDDDNFALIVAALAEVMMDYVPALGDNALSFLNGLPAEYLEDGPRRVRRQ
jgi:hypothetical protein